LQSESIREPAAPASRGSRSALASRNVMRTNESTFDLWRKLPMGWKALFVVCCFVEIITCGRVNILKVGPVMLALSGIFLLFGISDRTMHAGGIFILSWMAIAFMNYFILYKLVTPRMLSGAE
jgi:hypothetical protein